jgi:SAM-dependent methyltransferase
METIAGHLYDFPKYYDLIFGSDWKAEFDFLRGMFAKYDRKPVEKIFEPGCGTGRLMIKLAQAGYQVAGLDLNPHAVQFCNARLKRHGFPETAFVGDMAEFTLKTKVDACFNMINTFRHLPTEAAAEGHFRSIAGCLRRGGLYLLGLHLTPKTAQKCTEERWSATRGSLTVNSCLWSIETDLKKRDERIGMTYDVYTPTKQFRIRDETHFRTYSREQMRRLIEKTPELELIDTYDFRYDIDGPIDLDDETEDVVYVLKRR